jgi:hypothetical protein
VSDLLPLDEGKSRQKLTHYLFRYPAKFHPPVVAALLTRYTESGDQILDPFVGSGTLLVEAALHERQAVGVDVDPVAISVALAKTRRYDLLELSHTCKQILDRISLDERSAESYVQLMHSDISTDELDEICNAEDLKIPDIPNLHHWFRQYVAVDLARIQKSINDLAPDGRTALLFQVVFASIIRNCSNADPVPVSGLEYTSHMRQRDAAGRLINPFALFRGASKRALTAAQEWVNAIPDSAVEPLAFRGTALDLPGDVPEKVDAVVTSPPYHNAVDYYRRHQLEMFWLGHTVSQSERLALLPDYIGRPKVALSNPLLAEPWKPSALADEWERKIHEQQEGRASDFRHYVQAMTKVFGQLAIRMSPGRPAIFVLGQSRWNGEQIPTEELIAELARPDFTLQEVLSYPVKNRYMSYSRHNEANINREYVLVLRRS